MVWPAPPAPRSAREGRGGAAPGTMDSRLRGNDGSGVGGLPWIHAGRHDWRGPPPPWVPAFAGTTGGGAMDSRLRGNDGVGVGGLPWIHAGRHDWRGPPGAPGSRPSPGRRVGGLLFVWPALPLGGRPPGVVWPAAPAQWIPACAGMTGSGWGPPYRYAPEGTTCAAPPPPWVPAFAGTTGGGAMDSRLRGNDGGGVGGLLSYPGRYAPEGTTCAGPPPPWVPAFAGTTGGVVPPHAGVRGWGAFSLFGPLSRLGGGPSPVCLARPPAWGEAPPRFVWPAPPPPLGPGLRRDDGVGGGGRGRGTGAASR